MARVKLSALWAMLMFVYLLGDVLRIFAGDFVPGQIEGKAMTQGMLVGIALFMLIPVAMIFISLILPQNACKILCIALAGLLFVFNAVGLPSYSSIFDQVLIVVGLGINGLTIWQAVIWRV